LTTNEVVAPTSGLVVRVQAIEGSNVSEGDPVVTIQSMKTEITIRAEFGGRISRVLVREGEEVSIGQTLVQIDS
jgi:biotin carboxyl carrier protein